MDRSDLRGVVAAYFRAVDANDGRHMCGALTPELRRYVARPAADELREGAGGRVAPAP